VLAVEDEVHRDARIGQDALDGPARPYARVPLGRHGEDVVEVGGVAGAGRDGGLGRGDVGGGVVMKTGAPRAAIVGIKPPMPGTRARC